MRHFDYLGEADISRLFHLPPQPFDADSDPMALAIGLGATLYSPGTRPQLAVDIARQAALGVISLVVCLEDSIADEEVAGAERNVVEQLRAYAETGATGPLIFVRVRAAYQIPLVVEGLGEYLPVLAGFVIPKFLGSTGGEFLDAIAAASAASGRRLYAMPVLESPELVHRESRVAELLAVADLLAAHRSTILAVRIGATDLSSAYGLRRNRELTIYHVHVIADVISDIVNVLGRAGADGYVISGPVWEYFGPRERIFKPQLRESPFREHDERPLRARMLNADLDGLVREVVLDQANGLTGKTVIHPSHVAAVHALSVVSHEEYSDACEIIEAATGGVRASQYQNKMNEAKPHRAWALHMLRRAEMFGVLRPDVSYIDVLAASESQ